MQIRYALYAALVAALLPSTRGVPDQATGQQIALQNITNVSQQLQSSLALHKGTPPSRLLAETQAVV